MVSKGLQDDAPKSKPQHGSQMAGKTASNGDIKSGVRAVLKVSPSEGAKFIQKPATQITDKTAPQPKSPKTGGKEAPASDSPGKKKQQSGKPVSEYTPDPITSAGIIPADKDSIMS